MFPSDFLIFSDSKSTQPFVGFYAWKSFNATGEVCDIKVFDSVECNYGGYFDPKTGIFTAPLHGLYLVSISIGSPRDNKALTIVCNQKNNVDSVNLCDVSGNKTITRCTAMKARDKISLEMFYSNHDNNWIWVHFSCCLITCRR